MTTNQKLYCRWLRAIAMLTLACVGYLVICTNYGHPEPWMFITHSQ